MEESRKENLKKITLTDSNIITATNYKNVYETCKVLGE